MSFNSKFADVDRESSSLGGLWKKFDPQTEEPKTGRERLMSAFRKNVSSIQDYPETFPKMTFDKKSPVTRALVEHGPKLVSLFTHPSTGCLKLKDTPQTRGRIRDFVARGKDPKEIDNTVSPNTLESCNNRACGGPCQDCKDFQEQGMSAIRGIQENDPNTQIVHTKNLISALHGYRQHLLSRGLDKDSYTKTSFDPCVEGHQALSDSLYGAEKDIKSALESHGIPHSDEKAQI